MNDATLAQVSAAGELVIRALAALAELPPVEWETLGSAGHKLDQSLYRIVAALSLLSPQVRDSLRRHGKGPYTDLVRRTEQAPPGPYDLPGRLEKPSAQVDSAGELLIRAAAALAQIPTGERDNFGDAGQQLDRSVYQALWTLSLLSGQFSDSLRRHGKAPYDELARREWPTLSPESLASL